MASPSTLRVIEVCQIPPSFGSAHSPSDSKISLTFFDLFWLKFPPVERLFFYSLAQSTTRDVFYSVILPKIKHSLFLTLSHFPPLAGRLIWSPDSSRPVIVYATKDAYVLLTIAESDADFDLLSSRDNMVQAINSHPYVPKLPISETTSSILALQITFFPGKGFTIAYSGNHAALDGNSSTMFFKAWAYISKHGYSDTCLPPELTPFYDRHGIKDPSDLETVFLSQWAELTEAESKKNPRSLKVLPDLGSPKNQVRSMFQLSRQDIDKLKHKVLSESRISSVTLSTFALTCAYVSVCMVKARGGDDNRKVWFIFSVDCRRRLDPPVPKTYFGNCVTSHTFIAVARDYTRENGVSVIAERIGRIIKGLEKDVLEGMEETLSLFKNSLQEVQVISVAGSNRFEVYGCDFGWGKPKKVEITSIDRTGAIALNDSRDGNGGIEIGLALPMHEMEAFSCIFFNGLKNL